MKINQLEYQKNAIEFAINHLENNKIFNLEAPTGSGKTFIIGSLIEKYIKNEILNNSKTTFLFIAPSTGKLDYQGYEKITNYLNKNWLKGFSANYIGSSNTKKEYLRNIDYFKPNNVYFFGWQMFQKNTKITEIDSEKNDIYKVIYNTKQQNIKIILIIDEAHIYQETKKSQSEIRKNIIETINSNKTINVSATLEEKNIKPDYKISFEQVREECAIKKYVNISSYNDSIKNPNNYEENELLVLSAIQKQKEVKQQYFKKNINVNPLILVQIPNDTISENSYVLNQIKALLEKNNFKKDFNYAIWLNDEKTKIKKEDLVKNNSPIEILIFKQSIAIGWDIPRANILVRLRDTKEKSFNIQTLGRILRNQFFKYYENELIDNAYVYTNDENYRNYIKKESICFDSNENKKIKFSKKVNINEEIKINKIKIETNFNEEELIKHVGNQLLKSSFFQSFINQEFEKNNYKIIDNALVDTKNIINPKPNKIEKTVETNSQQSLDFSKPKETLVYTYIKYKTKTKSSTLINKILDYVVENLDPKIITIKKFYLLTIQNWDVFFNYENKKENTLKSKIEELINEFQSKNSIKKQEPYILPSEYILNEKYIGYEKWDNVNTYEFSLLINNLDSENEKKFYERFKDYFDDNNNVHIFRNGRGSQDYYIEYFDENFKIRKFYPDFIVINNSTKQIFVIEIKGINEKDIDKNTSNKIETFISHLDKIQINNSFYKCYKIFKCFLDSSNDLMFFENNEQNSKKFSDIKKLIKEFTP